MVAQVKVLNWYGYNYFGSGGGWGKMRMVNCRVIDYKDNGFILSPDTVQVDDENLDAWYEMVGGDCIGRGRYWAEYGVYYASLHKWFQFESHGTGDDYVLVKRRFDPVWVEKGSLRGFVRLNEFDEKLARNLLEAGVL